MLVENNTKADCVCLGEFLSESVTGSYAIRKLVELSAEYQILNLLVIRVDGTHVY